jgi:histidine ammonia-lyase
MRLTSQALTPREVVAVARDREPVEVDRSVGEAMAPARAVVEAAVASEHLVYGVTTGFGALADTVVPAEEAAAAPPPPGRRPPPGVPGPSAKGAPT